MNLEIKKWGKWFAKNFYDPKQDLQESSLYVHETNTSIFEMLIL